MWWLSGFVARRKWVDMTYDWRTPRCMHPDARRLIIHLTASHFSGRIQFAIWRVLFHLRANCLPARSLATALPLLIRLVSGRKQASSPSRICLSAITIWNQIASLDPRKPNWKEFRHSSHRGSLCHCLASSPCSSLVRFMHLDTISLITNSKCHSFEGQTRRRLLEKRREYSTSDNFLTTE